MSSQLATGIWHPSYLLKPNLQATDSCSGKAVLLVSDMSVLPPRTQSLEAEPVGKVFAVVPEAKLNMLEVTFCFVFHVNTCH